jgi:uncharacterized protein YnzC (UPF0291/DUF896 family)
MKTKFLTKLGDFPLSVPLESSIGIEIQEGVPILRASSAIQNRIDELLAKQQHGSLSHEEEQEFDCYEEIDDYLSLVNRTMRNMASNGHKQSVCQVVEKDLQRDAAPSDGRQFFDQMTPLESFADCEPT